MRTPYLVLSVLCGVLISLNVYSQDKPGAGLLPVPQKVSLTDQQYLLDGSWSVQPAANISKSDPAVLSLVSELKERFALRLNGANRSARIIQLIVKPGAVVIGQTTDTNRISLKKQAYRLTLDKDKISITANASQGLFYGVQTLIQLLQPNAGKTYFAGGEIVDWPDMDLRMIYWDDAHHLERLSAMKRAIRQASYYKINGFTVKLEGHFQFSGPAKPITEPYAYTPEEFQELTDYARARYVELVPYIDAPAHISFILKHPEFAGLRAVPNSNYEFSVMNPKADELLLSMFDELMKANKGGKYLVLSTDEAYYVGKSEEEKKRAAALGGNGKLLAEYITRIANKLHEKGRTIIIWAEYPLTIDDINSIPSHIVNGVYSDKWASKLKAHGMRQLIYTSVQGVEPFFPNYHKQEKKKSANKTLALNDDELMQGDLSKGRVGEVLKGITSSIAAGKSDFMGVIVAAWADAGLNPETFWLGYAAGAAPGWNSKLMTSQDLTQRFYHSFYGGKTLQMDKVYQLLSTQADFWDKSWDWEFANWRTPIIGNSYGYFDTAKLAKDQTLPALPVPSGADLSLNNDWNAKNKERLESVEKYLKENDELMSLLQENMASAYYQHYNLQVLRSVAQLCRQNLNMLLDMQRINDLLKLSSTTSGNPAVAVSLIDQALDQAKRIRDERNEVLQAVTTIWYQDWFPRVAEANGRKYLDQVDDVKDHQPIRTVDMSYLIYRQLKYPLGKWAEEVTNARNQFAGKNNLPVRKQMLDWEKY